MSHPPPLMPLMPAWLSPIMVSPQLTSPSKPSTCSTRCALAFLDMSLGSCSSAWNMSVSRTVDVASSTSAWRTRHDCSLNEDAWRGRPSRVMRALVLPLAHVLGSPGVLEELVAGNVVLVLGTSAVLLDILRW